MGCQSNCVTALRHEVIVRVVQLANQGILYGVKHRIDRALPVHPDLLAYQDLLQQLEVVAWNSVEQAKELGDEWVLAEVIRQGDIVDDAVRTLAFDRIPCLVIEVDIAQLRIDTVDQQRDLCEVVVFDNDGETLPQVATAPFDRAEVLLEDILRSILSVVSIEEVFDCKLVVRLFVEKHNQVSGEPVWLRLEHHVDEWQQIVNWRAIVQGCWYHIALTAIAVFGPKIRVHIWQLAWAERADWLSVSLSPLG
jgi:DNA polymerase III psi subunit